jgi:hypothetical protein
MDFLRFADARQAGATDPSAGGVSIEIKTQLQAVRQQGGTSQPASVEALARGLHAAVLVYCEAHPQVCACLCSCRCRACPCQLKDAPMAIDVDRTSPLAGGLHEHIGVAQGPSPYSNLCRCRWGRPCRAGGAARGSDSGPLRWEGAHKRSNCKVGQEARNGPNVLHRRNCKPRRLPFL